MQDPPPIPRRLEAIGEGGYNTFLLRTRDILLDMLTDSDTNAMTVNQHAARGLSPNDRLQLFRRRV